MPGYRKRIVSADIIAELDLLYTFEKRIEGLRTEGGKTDIQAFRRAQPDIAARNGAFGCFKGDTPVYGFRSFIAERIYLRAEYSFYAEKTGCNKFHNAPPNDGFPYFSTKVQIMQP